MPLIAYLLPLSKATPDTDELQRCIDTYEKLLRTGYSLGGMHRLTDDEKSAIGQQINRWRTALES